MFQLRLHKMSSKVTIRVMPWICAANIADAKNQVNCSANHTLDTALLTSIDKDDLYVFLRIVEFLIAADFQTKLD